MAFATPAGESESVQTTGLHKFYRPADDAWVSAQDLAEGDRLEGPDGPLVVQSLAKVPGTHRVYNLTVETEHVYRVSTLGALVHNNGCAQVPTIKGRIKNAQLPNRGKIRYVPPKDYAPGSPLPRGPNNGYIDRFGNEWTRGPSRTAGEAFEWDVQLSHSRREQLGWLSRDGSHVNVSLGGRVTHR